MILKKEILQVLKAICYKFESEKNLFKVPILIILIDSKICTLF